jgi:hypothetical protein
VGGPPAWGLGRGLTTSTVKLNVCYETLHTALDAQDRDRWRVLVRTMMNLHFLAPRSFFFPEGGVGLTQAWMPTYVSILRIPQMI